MFRMGHYFGIPSSPICLQIGMGICTVLTADTVTTSEVKNYYDSAKLSTSSKGSVRASFAGLIALAYESRRISTSTFPLILTNAHTHARTRARTHAHARARTRADTHTHTRTHTHARTHAHTHTHTQTQTQTHTHSQRS